MSTIAQKIAEIEAEMARTQKNKATAKHLGLLKAKLAKYRSGAFFFLVLLAFSLEYFFFEFSSWTDVDPLACGRVSVVVLVIRSLSAIVRVSGVGVAEDRDCLRFFFLEKLSPTPAPLPLLG